MFYKVLSSELTKSFVYNDQYLVWTILYTVLTINLIRIILNQNIMRWLLLLLLVACTFAAQTENVSVEPTNVEPTETVEEMVKTIDVVYADFTVTTLKLLEEKNDYWKYEYYKNGDYVIVQKKRLDGVEYWQVASAYFGEYDFGKRSDVQKALDIIQLGNKDLLEKQSMLLELSI